MGISSTPALNNYYGLWSLHSRLPRSPEHKQPSRTSLNLFEKRYAQYAGLNHHKGTLFFCFSLTRASCMRPAGKKRKKTHWAREGAVFGYHWTREGALHARHTAKNTHWTREGAVLSTTEHERVPYTHATRCTQRYKSTQTHWKDFIHYTSMYNCPSHADVRFPSRVQWYPKTAHSRVQCFLFALLPAAYTTFE